ncbi:unnamed protein product [Rotaria sp. Silwood1]|nr:unnamed protein product [Rotaria sp. Silwood1]CAF1211178.1 unnamed protein product [Rotaria sp. Silwood1]CAF3510811.1 unnamed protein product [Rotaria sp. Silwood1]CAF3571440.1 unnamed protein product [Rotaria sp. Silwood1]CAF4884284.1 unnamed protein product [Rotaria sp. Silwood1]
MSPCPYGYIIDDLGCQTCECNPCQLGLPLNEYPCEEGQSTCSNSKGICTVTAEGNTYCCPTEKSGSCPPSPDPSVVLCLPSNCNNDADCPAREKCCDPCFRCLNVTRS